VQGKTGAQEGEILEDGTNYDFMVSAYNSTHLVPQTHDVRPNCSTAKRVSFNSGRHSLMMERKAKDALNSRSIQSVECAGYLAEHSEDNAYLD